MNAENPKSSKEDYLQRDYHYPKLKARFGRREALALLSFPTAMALTACAGRADAAASYRRLLPLVTNDYDASKLTATPDTRPCSPWFVELAEMVRDQQVLEGVCLAYYTDRTQIPYDDIRRLLAVGDISGNADVQRRIAHVYAEPSVPRQQIVFVAGGERSRFRMVKVSLDAGLGPGAPNYGPSWQESYPMTPEGKEYAAASDAVVAYARSHGISLMDITHPLQRRAGEFGHSYYDDAAKISTVWYLDPTWLSGEVWAPMRSFAAKWWLKS